MWKREELQNASKDLQELLGTLHNAEAYTAEAYVADAIEILEQMLKSCQ